MASRAGDWSGIVFLLAPVKRRGLIFLIICNKFYTMADTDIEEIILQAGDSTTIKLKGLAAAGYEWNYTTGDSKDLVTISKDFVLEEKLTQKNMGTSADEVFTIKANKKGTLIIYFFQKRSWEKNMAPVNEKKIKIIIE